MQPIKDITDKLEKGPTDNSVPPPRPPDWQPTSQDIEEYLEARAWPSFTKIRTDLVSADERRKMVEAVEKTRNFVEAIKKQKGLALLIVADAMPDDADRTGCGCGKTMLARIAHASTGNVVYCVGDPESLMVIPQGKFYEARELMALFDTENYDPQHTFRRFGKLIVIDDVGREGNLRWEKRDEASQLEEKQARYYSVINYCYKAGINVVITSNMTARPLASFLGAATWSRLLQMAPEEYRINMTGIRDMRPVLAKANGHR